VPRNFEAHRREVGGAILALILANATLALVAIRTHHLGAVALVCIVLIVGEAAVLAWFAQRLVALLRDRQDAVSVQSGAEVALAESEAKRQAESQAAGEERAQLQQVAQDQRRVIEALGQGIQRLASSDLNLQLDQSFPPEHEYLRRDFNMAVEKLREAWRWTVDGAAIIRADANQLVADLDAILRRSALAGRSFGEASISLDEIAAAIKEEGEEAALARRTVAATKADAESSRRVVRRATEALSSIERMLGQIGQITAVIDEIAFQTNLLALNAGIEAAHAGEAGHGFASIAGKVRALAQRSTEAAEDIQRMVSASGSDVRGGAVLVAESGRIVERMLTQIAEIQRAIETMASGAQAHTAGLSHIARAQASQWTQQNQAELESSAGMARRLVLRSEDLARQALNFTLGEAGNDRLGRPEAAPGRPRPARPNLRIVRRDETKDR